MKRYAIGFLAIVVAAAATASPALAAFRVPQVPIVGGALQATLSAPAPGPDQTINVNTEQWDSGVKRWTAAPTNAGIVTLQIELTSGSATNEIGIYNSDAGNPPTHFPLFNGLVPAGWYAIASFTLAGNLNVTLFDDQGGFQGLTPYAGVHKDDFGFYIKNGLGEFGYTQDARNSGGEPRALVFAGTGLKLGDWWVCFEDNLAPPPALVEEYVESQNDFDDAVLLVEALNPTPVSKTSWGALKSRFR